MANWSIRGDWSFSDLVPEDVPEMLTLCPACIYWELPRDFSDPSTSADTSKLKADWLRRHGMKGVLGKTLRIEGDFSGFIQFGSPGLYPQCLTYASGPVSSDAMLITCLYVAQAYRGRGCAGALLSAAEEIALTDSYRAVEHSPAEEALTTPPGPLSSTWRGVTSSCANRTNSR